MKQAVSLPPNELVKGASLQTVESGLSRGTLALELTLAAGGSLGQDFGAVVKAILDVQLPRALKVVRLRGAVDRVDDVEMMSLLDVLANYDRVTQVVVDGSRWHLWMPKAPWIILHTASPEVLVPANEIHYTPAEIPLRDIQFAGDKVLRNAYMYLNIADLRVPPAELTKFMVESPHAWSIL